MPEQYLITKVNFSWHLIWIFALLEGATVPLVPLFFAAGPRVKPPAGTAAAGARFALFVRNMLIIGINGMLIGFIGTLIICLLLNYIAFRRIKVHVDTGVVVRLIHPFITGLWGALLLAIMFWIQQFIGLLISPSVVNLFIFGFVSAAGSIIATSALYMLVIKGLRNLGIQLLTTEQQLLLARIPIVWFAILIGLYEGFAVPIFHLWELVPRHRVLFALLVGLSGGALSSLIVTALAHMRAINKHLWLKFSVVDK